MNDDDLQEFPPVPAAKVARETGLRLPRDIRLQMALVAACVLYVAGLVALGTVLVLARIFGWWSV